MKERLDVLLVKRNLASSREKAKAIIMSGNVFVDGQIDFDAIYGGEQRVNIQKIDLEKVDIVAPEQSHALDSYQQIPLKDCSSGFDKDRHYIAVYRGDDGNSVRIRFTPDETLLNNMKAKARSKIQS